MVNLRVRPTSQIVIKSMEKKAVFWMSVLNAVISQILSCNYLDPLSLTGEREDGERFWVESSLSTLRWSAKSKGLLIVLHVWELLEATFSVRTWVSLPGSTVRLESRSLIYGRTVCLYIRCVCLEHMQLGTATFRMTNVACRVCHDPFLNLCQESDSLVENLHS